MRTLLALVVGAACAVAGDIAFVDVTVVPMDRETRLVHRTVLVRDGVIASVGAVDDVTIPEGARRIDGRGKFLMPGLADMHVHVWYEEEFLLFLANGVTTVRNLWGTPLQRRWQQEIARGERLAPNLYTTGTILDGKPPTWQRSRVVTTPDEARAAVRAQADAGYPAIKVYSRLRPDVYHALVDEAGKRKLRVTGHVPWSVGIEGVIAAGQRCIEHLDGYVVGHRPFQPKILAQLAEKTAKAGVWNCPTLVVYTKFVPPAGVMRERARPEMRFVPPRLRATWDPSRDFRIRDATPATFRALRRTDESRRQMVKMLQDAGARLLLGTDSSNPFVVAGWSVHEELELLVGAGLTPFEALRTGTANAGAYCGEAWGTVAEGQRADLLLLDRDPLADVAHIKRPAGVMVRGRFLARAEFDHRLKELAASYERPKRRLAKLPPLAGDTVRWVVRWNDVDIAEGRLADDGHVLRAQQVLDPPWPSIVETTVRVDKDGLITALEERRREPGNDRTRKLTDAMRRTLPKGATLRFESFPFWWLASKRFADLAVGETRDLTWADVRLDETRLVVEPIQFRRMPDRDGRRVFVFRSESNGVPTRGRVLLRKDGAPVRVETELQLGTVVFELVSD